MKRVNDPNYYNFEFNCIGTCDASYRESRDSKKSLTPEEYASIRRFQVFLMSLLQRNWGFIAGSWWLPFLSG